MQTSLLVLGVVLYDDTKMMLHSEKSWNWVYEPETYETNHAASLKFVSQTLLCLRYS